MKFANILWGVLGICLVVGIHEFGHWSLCHVVGVGTPIFSIGVGPSLTEFRLGNTQFSIGLFPIGGFVEMLGSRLPVAGFEQQSFASQPFVIKMFIILGGIIFNLLFGLLMLFCSRFVAERKKQSGNNLCEGECTHTSASSPSLKRQIIGPVGIITLVAKGASAGLETYLYIIGVLSLNLAIFNLIPLPLLDGGQLVIAAYERIIGNPLSDIVYDTFSLITIFILVAILLYTTSKDIWAFRRIKS